jgi:hypothetical protein
MSARKASSFDEAARALDLGMLPFWFSTYPDEQSRRLTERVKMAAKLLGRAADLQHSKALDAVAQAIRFPAWHGLSAHLAKGVGAQKGQVSQGWLDSLSGALLLMVEAEDDVALPSVQVDAFERFGETLAMLTDSPKQVVLDGVSAPLCAGRSWEEVRSRSPLKARAPIYAFVVPQVPGSEDVGGYFEASAACRQLAEELDERQEDFADLPKAKKREVRRWVEDTLAAQPGFLEGGLALAWIQFDADEPEAASTVNRFIRQAEALIPADYKGKIAWGHLGNRFYLRLLWLRLELHHAAGELPAAAKLARKQLKLNPDDNLGVRYVLPLLLLQQGEVVAAHRAATKYLDDESGLTAAAIRAFCEHALDNHALFRRELAAALFSLPWLRLFLLNQRGPLPDGDDGIRAVQPALETFTEFAWPVYVTRPGLRKACESFLAEPEVLQAESELRQYWKGYWRRDGNQTGSREGWDALCNKWIEAIWRRPLSVGPARGARAQRPRSSQ